MIRRLSDLKPGEEARVRNVEAAAEAGRRVLEMGLTPGVHVRLVGAAPLGDPLIFELRGYRLGLRRAEADLVGVEPIEGAPAG